MSISRPLPPLVAPGPELTHAQVERYARHLLLPHIGELGQRRLLEARVCVIGAGGLGSPVLLYLAAAGIGTIGIVDDDAVDISNLQRQVIHPTGAVGMAKVDSAAEAVARANPEVTVVRHRERLDVTNVDAVLGDYDVVVDGADNFPTRYLVNDACERLRLPCVWASLERTAAQVSVFWRAPLDGGPGVDLRDLFPTPPTPGSVPSCGDAGVLGALCGTVGGVMAGEVVKLVTGTGTPLLGRVLLIDSLTTRMSELPLAPRDRSHDEELLQGPDPGLLCAGPVPAASAASFPSISARELAMLLDGDDAPTVLDVREPGEVAIAALPGSVRVPVGEVEAGHLPSGLTPDVDLVVHCKTGPRAERAAMALRAKGFDRIRLLDGGVLAWIDEVDPSLPRY